MPVITSQYWNAVHGYTPEDVRKDAEGMQTMRTLADNMAWTLKVAAETAVPRPTPEPQVFTNFMDGK